MCAVHGERVRLVLCAPTRRVVALERVCADRALVRDLAARPRAEPERCADVRGCELTFARCMPLECTLLQRGRHKGARYFRNELHAEIS